MKRQDRSDRLACDIERMVNTRRIVGLPMSNTDIMDFFVIMVHRYCDKRIKWRKWAENWISGKDRTRDTLEKEMCRANIGKWGLVICAAINEYVFAGYTIDQYGRIYDCGLAFEAVTHISGFWLRGILGVRN